jgi:hypothetical protein
MILQISRRWLNRDLPKVVVGTILVVVAIWNLKDVIAPETALVTNRLNLMFKSDDCPPTLKPGHSFRLEQDKTVIAELWFPAYDNSVCKISVSALVSEGRSVSIEALRNSNLSQIPLFEDRVDTASDQNHRYLRVSNDVPVAPNPKPANPPSAEVGPPPPPPPGGPKILVHISDALTQRSYIKESLYISITDNLKAFDHVSDMNAFGRGVSIEKGRGSIMHPFSTGGSTPQGAQPRASPFRLMFSLVDPRRRRYRIYLTRQNKLGRLEHGQD